MDKRLGPGTRLVCSLFAALLLWLTPFALAASEFHTFEFDSRSLGYKPQSVNLAGSFNGWSKDATPMKDDGNGVYKATVDLPAGVVYYKFVVNGEKWLNDPKADKELEQDDNNGGKNSAVLIGPDIRKAPPPAPNHINRDLVRFDPKEDVDYSSDGELRLRIRTQARDVQHVVAQTSGGRQELSLLGTEGGYDIFGGVINVTPAKDSVMYRFELSDGTATLPVNSPNEIQMFIAYPSPAKTPDWAKNAVWYQIFPERFRNGDPSNDPGDQWFERLVPWKSDWWATLPGEAPGQENFYKGEGNVWRRRYGGDIQGVKWALPYLRTLGVNAIYLNPVFEAESMHKYDTADYRHIDQHFGVKGDLPIAGETDDPSTWKWSGSDKVFLDFVAEAHRQGFKVVIDGVFNHVGRAHPFFQDVVKNGKNSKYADWFEIEDFGSQTPADPKMFGKPGGMKFKAWDGASGHLPVFKKDAQLGLARGASRSRAGDRQTLARARRRSVQRHRRLAPRRARRHPAPVLGRVPQDRQRGQTRRLHHRRNLGLGTGLAPRRSVRRGDELPLRGRGPGLLRQSKQSHHAHAVQLASE